MQSKFILSVIVPVYNSFDYLDKSLKTIVKQTIGFEENVELILVNDGSNDNSEAICLKYKKLYPHNVVYIKQTNGGVSKARNNGLKVAHGKYVMFFDSDDKWDLGAFKEGIKCLESDSKLDSVWFRMRFFDSFQGFHPLSFVYDRGKNKINILEDDDCIECHAVNMIFRKNDLRGIWFDVNLKYAEDMKFLDEYLLEHHNIGLIKNYNYYYRQSKTSVTQKQFLDITFYDVINRAFLDIFDMVKDKFNYIPRYFQYSVMYQLQTRIRNGIKINMSSHDQEKYKQSLHQLLELIDDDIILQQRSLTLEHKMMALSIKYGRQIMKFITIHDNQIFIKECPICDTKDLANVISNFEILNNKLKIKGEIFFFQPLEMFYTSNKHNKKIDLVSNMINQGKLHTDMYLYKYDLTIALDNLTNLKFYIKINNQKIMLTNCLTNYAKLSNIPFDYYIKDYYLITIDKKGILFHVKRNHLFKIKKEIIFLINLLFKERKCRTFLIRILYWMTMPFIRNISLVYDKNIFNKNRELESKLSHTKIYFVVNCKMEEKHQQKLIKKNSLKHKLYFLHSKYLVTNQEFKKTNPFGESYKYYASLGDYQWIKR